jgi:hypothetical protein
LGAETEICLPRGLINFFQSEAKPGLGGANDSPYTSCVEAQRENFLDKSQSLPL